MERFVVDGDQAGRTLTQLGPRSSSGFGPVHRVQRATRHPAIPGAAPTRGPALTAKGARGALVYRLRHTYGTELANANVSVYPLMTLLGHESMVTSQALCHRRPAP
jgi:integrase